MPLSENNEIERSGAGMEIAQRLASGTFDENEFRKMKLKIS